MKDVVSFAVPAIFLLIIPRPPNTLLATLAALAGIVQPLPEEVLGVRDFGFASLPLLRTA